MRLYKEADGEVDGLLWGGEDEEKEKEKEREREKEEEREVLQIRF